jgi:hypothetical protein
MIQDVNSRLLADFIGKGGIVPLTPCQAESDKVQAHANFAKGVTRKKT